MIRHHTYLIFLSKSSLNLSGRKEKGINSHGQIKWKQLHWKREFNKMFGTHRKMNEKAPIFSNTGNYIEHEKNSNPKTSYKADNILFEYIKELLLLGFYF